MLCVKEGSEEERTGRTKMQLLHEVAKILRSKYNNLRHERDWELLFDHLLKKVGGGERQGGRKVKEL